MRLRLLCSAIVLFSAALPPGEASAEDEPYSWPISLSAFHESLWHDRATQRGILNPGLQVGTEYAWFDLSWFQLVSSANLGAYHHRGFQNVGYVNTEFGARLTAPFHLQAEALLGIGLLHTFEPGPVYGQGEDGRLKRVVDLGRPHAMPSLAFGFGFAPPEQLRLPLVLFCRYQVFAEMPWSVARGGFFLPHQTLSAGIRLPLRELQPGGGA